MSHHLSLILMREIPTTVYSSDPCVTTAAVGLVPGPSLCWSLYIVKPASWAGLGWAGLAQSLPAMPQPVMPLDTTWTYIIVPGVHNTAYISLALALWNEVSDVCKFIRYNNSNKHFI